MRDMSICTEKKTWGKGFKPFLLVLLHTRNVMLRFLMFERYIFELTRDILKYL